MGIKNRRNKTKRRGGAATVFPLKYFDPSVHEPSANAGHDLLKAIPPLGIRPRIGGKRGRTKRVLKKSNKSNKSNKSKSLKKQRGGFVPSVMGNFVAAASKYIVPLALYAGYKMMTKKQKKQK